MALKEDQELNKIMADIAKTLRYIEKSIRPAHTLASKFELEMFVLKTNGTKERTEVMKLQLNENAQINVKKITDDAGNEALIDGKITYAVKGDLNLGDLTVSEDGLSALFKRNGAVGKVTVQLSADADLGPDEKIFVGEVEIECLGGEAVKFELEAVAVPA